MTQPLPHPEDWYHMYLQELSNYTSWRNNTGLASEETMRCLYGEVCNRRLQLLEDLKENREMLRKQELSPIHKAVVERALVTLQGQHAATEFVEGLFDMACKASNRWKEGFVLARISLAVGIEEFKTKLLLLGEEP